MTKETAEIDMLCDMCMAEMPAGTTFHVSEGGPVLCASCGG